MGNTILAHTLFACNKVDLDLSKFFSTTGNAHAIWQINKSILRASHLIENPNPHWKCVLSVICEDWWKVLLIKFSYSKWMEEVPTINNYSKFFKGQYTLDFDVIVQQFAQKALKNTEIGFLPQHFLECPIKTDQFSAHSLFPFFFIVTGY